MAESTALEALTAELLGDVGVLHDEIKTLRDVMPTIADVLSQKMNATSEKIGDALLVQGGNYLAAAEKLAAVLTSMSEEVDRVAEQAAVRAAEAVKLDIRQAAAESASGAIREAVGVEVGNVIGRVNDAANAFTTAANQAKAGKATWGGGRLIGSVIVGSVIGSLIAVLIFKFIPIGGMQSSQGVQLSESERSAIENGNKIQKVWNNLTQKERDHINDLLREAH